MVEHVFRTNRDFDTAMVYFIRKTTANFMRLPGMESQKINGMELSGWTISDAESYEDYIDDIVLKFGEDARGVVLNLVPVIFRV